MCLVGILLLLGAEEDVPTKPTSPKATDAFRVDAAAISKAATAYWAACKAADKRLANELNSAADAAHSRNDGKEEQACRDALKDVNERIGDEEGGIGGLVSVGPLKSFRYEKQDAGNKKK